ncbi:MAG: glycerate kinase [Clostridia bacterium]|nr:glycerate kinase [Clostridia bacterium]
MKVVVAIDSFKGSLSSIDAGNAVATAVKELSPNSIVEVVSLADGGEGTVESLVLGAGGSMQSAVVSGPFGEKVTANYGIIGGDTAVIEISSAAGITLVKKEDLNPLKATTYGVGELILHALENGCRKFIVGLGGSATNDCGVGMLKALGYSFVDGSGNEVGLGAQGLKDIAKIITDKADIRLKDCVFEIACDVKNPLVGKHGCSEIFSRQKGATDEMVVLMDGYIDRFADLTLSVIPTANKMAEGVGAAGGLGFAFTYYLNGKTRSGIELVIEKIALEEKVKTADLVVTGEGRLDSQSAMGKAPVGVSKLAKKYGKKVIAFCGSVGDGAEELNNHGIDAFFSILNAPCTLEFAMDKQNAKENLVKTAKQVLRLWLNI